MVICGGKSLLVIFSVISSFCGPDININLQSMWYIQPRCRLTYYMAESWAIGRNIAHSDLDILLVSIKSCCLVFPLLYVMSHRTRTIIY